MIDGDEKQPLGEGEIYIKLQVIQPYYSVKNIQT